MTQPKPDCPDKKCEGKCLHNIGEGRIECSHCGATYDLEEWVVGNLTLTGEGSYAPYVK